MQRIHSLSLIAAVLPTIAAAPVGQAFTHLLQAVQFFFLIRGRGATRFNICLIKA
jgi:hypothetical protein